MLTTSARGCVHPDIALDIATRAEKVTEDLERVEMQRAVKNAMRLFERIEEFDAKSRRANRGDLAPADARAIADALTVLAQLLTPFAPHVGEELWIASGAEGPATWPESGGRSREGLRKPVAS